MTTAYVAEDEPLAREGLLALFAEAPGWTVVGHSGDGARALEECLALRPDLLLTDVRMPKVSGLELAAELRGAALPIEIAFVTAHDAHAVQAFRVAAVDYLLKPVRTADFHECLRRAVRRIADGRGPAAPDARGFLQAIVMRSAGRLDVVPVAEVVAVRATGNYLEVRTATRTFLHRQTMDGLAEALDPAEFVRVHRSHLVARRHVRAVVRTDDTAAVVLTDGERLPISRGCQAAALRRLGGRLD